MTLSTSLSVLQADQRTRWQRGECVRVEDYLARHPGLADDPERLLDLIYHEVILREEAGEQPSADDYDRRFPALADQLRPLFEVHAALADLSPQPSQSTVPPIEKTPNATTPDEEPLAAGTPVLPGYDILTELGRGGGGVVYQAHHHGLNRLVAVKVLASASSATKTVRFRAEALLAARLQHPNIVQVYEIGQLDDGRPFFVMEYVEGGSLASRIAGMPHPAEDAARLVATVARGVHHAHQAGIVHRDLKPANVLLQQIPSRRGAEAQRPEEKREGNIGSASPPVLPSLSSSDLCVSAPLRECFSIPKVADFGLAKDLGDSAGVSRTGDVMGTPSYMAPEQARGRVREIGPRTDVYALGAILYELLTGRPPFQAATPLETLRLVLEEEPVSLERLRGKTPRDLQTICLKCLQKDPAGRYATAAELADDLERFLDGRPVLARPVSRRERVVRWARRHPSAAALAALTVVAELVLGVVWQQGAAREQDRLNTARGQTQEALKKGQRAFGHKDYKEAQSLAGEVLKRLKGEPRLQDLRPDAEELHTEAGHYLKQVTDLGHGQEQLPRFVPPP